MELNMMPRAVGVYLAGERPTEEEKQELEKRAKAKGFEKYKIKLIVAWDLGRKRREVSLHAIEA